MNEEINKNLENIEWTFNICCEDQRYFTFLKKVIRHTFRKNWFTRVSTPIIEKQSVYDNIFWESNVENVMPIFWLKDKINNEKLILRPSNTVWIFSLYLNTYLEYPQPVSLYYLDEQFKKIDNLSDSRFTEYFQVWCEVIGENDQVIDAQIISMGQNILDWLWLEWKYTIYVNSMWLPKETEKYKEELKSFLLFREQFLTEKDKEILEINPLEIFNSENEDVQELLSQSPIISEFIKKKSSDCFNKFKEYLDLFEVKYEEDTRLINPSIIYWSIVFKFVDKKTWQTLISGWRKNSLIKTLWHKKDVPALWWSMIVPRVMNLVKSENIKIRNKDKIDVFLMQLWDDARKLLLPLSQEARNRWLNVMLSIWTPSIKVQNTRAIQLKTRFIVIVWIMEARNWTCQLKDLQEWTQSEVQLDELLDMIVDKIWEENLTYYSPLKDLIIGEQESV